ncbi:hypothetical protein J7376_01120 [Paracoccus sp. R12_1]|uniref:hypothetical protein n=1 Tax=unclassified Paracoccus (in: a-proteobacteria) TaxID=2688777 RepID=UPI001ADBCE7B|nr:MULTISPECIES: hypothetical protein [unclassified Paracoccus (in: a-proteobacteria)]MBO9454322.1 hypothetical protein [Paracoccus sp. R12_2]MBO9485108.1 hypothetical protein [Paracoccus sp. R12_1]
MTILDAAALQFLASLSGSCQSRQDIADLIAREMSPEMGAGVLLMYAQHAEHATTDPVSKVIVLASRKLAGP